jgi:putative transposase
MDQASLPLVTRFVEQAPVRGRAAAKAAGWKWSSAGAHLKGKADAFVDAKGLGKSASAWKVDLAKPLAPADLKIIAACEHTGRPLGSPAFVKSLEKKLGRTLARQRPGPKPKAKKKAKR